MNIQLDPYSLNVDKTQVTMFYMIKRPIPDTQIELRFQLIANDTKYSLSVL